MKYSGELLAIKATLLGRYLEETSGLKDFIKTEDFDTLDVKELTKRMKRRDRLISQLREIDSKIEQDRPAVESAAIVRQREKNFELIKQIQAADTENEELFAKALENMEVVIQRHADTVRTFDAYFSHQLQHHPKYEWSK